MKLKYFDLGEFDSKDRAGSGVMMQQSTLEMLDRAREIAGVPFVINSGYRTTAHNKKVGGSASSSHLRGYAVDIATTGRSQAIILHALKQAGFKRFGIGATFIHADNDPGKPEAVWKY